MQSSGATETGPQSDNKLGGKFSGFCQATAGAGCQVGPHRATASRPAQHSQARLVPEQARLHAETQEDREMGRGCESGGRLSVGVRGDPQSQTERTERVGRVKQKNSLFQFCLCSPCSGLLPLAQKGEKESERRWFKWNASPSAS